MPSTRPSHLPGAVEPSALAPSLPRSPPAPAHAHAHARAWRSRAFSPGTLPASLSPSTCMCMCACVHVHVCMCICVRVCMRMCMCISLSPSTAITSPRTEDESYLRMHACAHTHATRKARFAPRSRRHVRRTSRTCAHPHGVLRLSCRAQTGCFHSGGARAPVHMHVYVCIWHVYAHVHMHVLL